MTLHPAYKTRSARRLHAARRRTRQPVATRAGSEQQKVIVSTRARSAGAFPRPSRRWPARSRWCRSGRRSPGRPVVTRLVENNRDAVVNIATTGKTGQRNARLPGDMPGQLAPGHRLRSPGEGVSSAATRATPSGRSTVGAPIADVAKGTPAAGPGARRHPAAARRRAAGEPAAVSASREGDARRRTGAGTDPARGRPSVPEPDAAGAVARKPCNPPPLRPHRRASAPPRGAVFFARGPGRAD